jgi:alpha-1,6-mannosyltransferase
VLLPWGFYGLLFAANAGWLWLVAGLRRAPGDSPGPRFLVAFAAAALLRVLAVAMPPSCSDDLARYVWEGLVQHQGHNPFLVEPRNPLLWPLAEQHLQLWLGINNKGVAAAYPPAQQMLFFLVTAVTGSVWGMKLLFAAADLVTFAALWRFLPAVGVPARWALVHGLAPLVALEFAAEGHNDAFAILALVCALGLLAAGRPRLAGSALGLGIAAKVLPVLALPFLWRKDRRVLVPCLVVYALLWLPYLAPASTLLQPLVQYGASWRCNDGLFGFVLWATTSFQQWLTRLGVPWNGGNGVLSFLAYGPAHQVARLPVLLLFAGVLAWIWRRRLPPWHATGMALLGFLLLAPTVQPWYVAWLVPLLCAWRSPASQVFVVLVPLAYVTVPRWRSERVWVEPEWARWLEYLPVWLALIWAGLRGSSRGLRAR